VALGAISGLAADMLQRRATRRIGITGLARAGKTALITSLAANMLALSGGRPALPAVVDRLRGRRLSVSISPAGASDIPLFEVKPHTDALAADPPSWPARTTAVSVLALDVDCPREGVLTALGPLRRRLEVLDYPGEWLLDLPLVGQDFAAWSEATLRRLETLKRADIPRAFLSFVRGLPAGARAEEALSSNGHRLYVETLRRMRDEIGLAFLQPGRFLMPPSGAQPPWMQFFPLPGRSPLARAMQARFSAYLDAVQRDLMSPMFGQLDSLVVVADLLSALHQGQAAFTDAQLALATAADALHWERSWSDYLAALAQLKLPPSPIKRVAFVATKADHIAARQRGNLASLMRHITRVPQSGVSSSVFSIASVRCTEDVVETLSGRPVSAVRGRIIGGSRPARFYPGEVPDSVPDDMFWQHRFLALPNFEPMRLPEGGRGGIPQIGLDALISFLLADML